MINDIMCSEIPVLVYKKLEIIVCLGSSYYIKQMSYSAMLSYIKERNYEPITTLYQNKQR